MPLETAGVPGSSRHRLDHLQDQRELQHNYYDREASSGFAGCGGLLLFMVDMRWPVDSDWTRKRVRYQGELRYRDELRYQEVTLRGTLPGRVPTWVRYYGSTLRRGCKFVV